jgi:Ca-activated chloride channel family protein
MIVWYSTAAFLFFIPLFLAVVYLIYKRKALRATVQISSFENFKKIPMTLRAQFSYLPTILKIIGLILAIVALARPQEANTKIKRNIEGIDIMIAFDISDSMLIEDMQPENRLESAKLEIEKFISKRTSDRIGLVVFSGEAYTRVPLTLDYKMLLNSVKQVQTSREIKMGTAIGVALAAAAGRLKDSTAKSRVVVFMTDGENNSGTIDPDTAVKIAQGYGIKVYSIGLGRDGDAQLPVLVQDFRGRMVKRYRPIHSTVNDELLDGMAKSTGGKYWRATDGEALEKVFSEINRLEKTKIDVNQYTRYKELFQTYLKWAVILYMLSFILSRTLLRRNP